MGKLSLLKALMEAIGSQDEKKNTDRFLEIMREKERRFDYESGEGPDVSEELRKFILDLRPDAELKGLSERDLIELAQMVISGADYGSASPLAAKKEAANYPGVYDEREGEPSEELAQMTSPLGWGKENDDRGWLPVSRHAGRLGRGMGRVDDNERKK